MRKQDFEDYKKLRDEGHSIGCVINMVLANEECRCEVENDKKIRT